MLLLFLRSRNALLSSEARKNALCLHQALNWAQTAVQQQALSAAEAIALEVKHQITAAGGKVDYVEVSDTHTCKTTHALNTIGRAGMGLMVWQECAAGD